jgi:hypothetical protein
MMGLTFSRSIECLFFQSIADKSSPSISSSYSISQLRAIVTHSLWHLDTPPGLISTDCFSPVFRSCSVMSRYRIHSPTSVSVLHTCEIVSCTTSSSSFLYGASALFSAMMVCKVSIDTSHTSQAMPAKSAVSTG